MTDTALVTQWAACGIASAAARFVPVPLLDDVIRERATRLAVVRTMKAHHRTYPAQLLEPLWDDGEEQRRGMSGRLRAAGRRVLLFPVRKYTALFGAVRGVPNDVMRLVLLARTLDRQLDRGAFGDAAQVTEQAKALRGATDEAIAGMDLRLLTAALADALSQGRGLGGAAVAFARSRFADEDDDGDVQLAPDEPVTQSAQHVAETLRRPEVAKKLEEFDAKVDALFSSG